MGLTDTLLHLDIEYRMEKPIHAPVPVSCLSSNQLVIFIVRVRRGQIGHGEQSVSAEIDAAYQAPVYKGTEKVELHRIYGAN